jgi:molybdopterin-containing oxidoreductase family iron-sulfur binding subunit
MRFWRNLNELHDGSKAQRRVLPSHLAALAEPINRSNFLKLMGASMALAGLTACVGEPKGQPQIAPYSNRPPGVSEDTSLFYASAVTHKGYAEGVLVRTIAGRPIKVEGNPQHPASLGATTIFGQATLHTMYDPDRSQSIVNQGATKVWSDVVAALQNVASAQKAKQGGGLRILTETVTSPTLADQFQTLLRQFPSAKWHQWEPLNRDNVREGSNLAFGSIVNTVYRVDQANVILTLDADLLNGMPGSLRHARDFATKRQVTPTNANQNRLYAIESTPTVTGMSADHRLPVRAGDVAGIAAAVAAGVGVAGVTAAAPAGNAGAWVSAVAKDLTANKGKSLVVAGDEQPPSVHLLAHQINAALGNVGQTLFYTDPVEVNPVNQLQSLKDLVQDLNSGAVDFLLIVGANPVFTAPPDLGFAAALAKAKDSLHLGLYQDETAAASGWHVPLAHELESWSDARAVDGTATIIQPQIQPLYGGKTGAEVLAVLNGQAAPPHDLVKGHWQRQTPVSDFEGWWRGTLNDGIVANTALPAKQVTLKAGAAPAAPAAAGQGFEIIFRPDPTIYDGRYANNGWLQELPKPLSQLTWDNVAYLSPATAQKLGVTMVANKVDVVNVSYKGANLRVPAYIQVGHPDDSITVHLGYGRGKSGQIGTGIGYNGYLLRSSSALWFDQGVQVTKAGDQYSLATTQGTQDMQGRDIVMAGTLDEYRKDPSFLQKEQVKLAGSMYAPYPYPENRWGMSINLSSCIGCNACISACVAENNIPVVGKEQVIIGRHMHWLRVDRYYEGDSANPTSYAQPVPCMQCENAPCEVVCPVGATTHSDEGLNDMVYNRCVGTRYCSNNCPYKVRRFNFLQFSDYTTPSLKLLNNPDVTVRERGVMEKCTYCVQRIRKAESLAEREGRPVKDGEIQTACQAACPAQAITFGNLNDANSQVAKLKAQPLNYDLLAELNTHPRTSYLGAIRNPNPEIKV